MAELAVDENEAVLALGLDRGQKRLDHRWLVDPPVGRGRCGSVEAVLSDRTRADAAFHHHPVAAEMVEGGKDIGGAGAFGPERRDRGGPGLFQLLQVKLVRIPADYLDRIGHHHARRLQRLKPLKEFILGFGIVPRRTEIGEVEPGQLLQRRAPVDPDQFGAGPQARGDGIEQQVVLERIGTAGGRAGQGIGASEEGDFRHRMSFDRQ